MQTDYIIVGLGLAGLAFAEKLRKENKTFVVFDDQSQQASLVAAGVYNPVILKRFTPVWDAMDQLSVALPFYKELEQRLNVVLDHKFEILRIFKSVEEQNNWFKACDRPVLSNFMIPAIAKNTNTNVIAPFNAGKVTNVGRIDIVIMINSYKEYLESQNRFHSEQFDYKGVEIFEDSVSYKDITAKKIVFCEGYGIHKNPFFKDVELQEVKGELLTIYAPGLNVDEVLKAAVFVLPLGGDKYRVGATFTWADKTNEPTEKGRQELVEKLKTVIKTDFEIIDQSAGIRPAVKDRRPLLGRHKEYPQLAVLNGLGTRGVMLAPKMAQLLYDHLENNADLPPEVLLYRFHK